MQTITKLPASTDGIEPVVGDLDGWVRTAGNPETKTWVLHTSADGAMISGIWECTVGSYHATYTSYEYVVMIAGRIVITPDGGTPVTVKAGDSFVVEKDFKGTWKIEENVRKHFDFVVG
ncbi:MAG: cupin domain-containing protein [Paracoccaceae bacterium]